MQEEESEVKAAITVVDCPPEREGRRNTTATIGEVGGGIEEASEYAFMKS
ncbi:hypothetical protein Hanom_Chr09g00836481 [Helianthus anomalus]